MTSIRRDLPEAAAMDDHVAASTLPWKRARDGLAFKLLRCCPETGTWVTVFRQEAGSSVPPHRHQGRGEYFVIRGSIELGGGAENGGVTAVAGDYGVEPSGANHDRTLFPVETEYLFIHHGAIAYLDDLGRVERTMDAQGIRDLWDTAEPIETGSLD
jgi:acetylacetone-cleaving enzyme